MRVDPKLIAHLRALARIELSPEFTLKIANQLETIIGYVEQLQEVDTDGIPPTSLFVGGKKTGFRKDRVIEGLPRDIVIDQAPDSVDGYFRVPRVIGEEEP